MNSRRVELIYFEGCPNVDEARSNLREALTSAKETATWTEWDNESDATPDRYRQFGSPTVLVDGQDVTGSARGNEAMACRADGPPSVSTILAMLR